MSEWIDELISPLLDEIKRKDMPQLRDKNVEEVLDILDDREIEYSKGKVQCGKLKSTQEDFIPSKRDNMAKSLLSGEMKLEHIFVSDDGYILDGHHRWLACKKIYGEDYEIPVVQIKLPKIDALKMFDKVVNESPDEVGNLNFGSSDARAFGYYIGKMYVGSPSIPHSKMFRMYEEDPPPASRKGYKFSGRIWTRGKIISFWEYPKNLADLKKVLSDIKRELKKKYKESISFGSWKIEIVVDKKDGNPVDQKVLKKKLSDDWSDNELRDFSWTSKLIPINQYTGSSERSEKEKNKQHQESPLAKKPRKVYEPKKKGKMTQTQYHQTRYTSENIITENPDVIETMNVTADWFEPDTRPFGYLNNVMKVGPLSTSHDESIGKRYTFKFPGRLWKKKKLISFWEYPNKSQLTKLLKDIEKVSNIKFNNSWKIEVVISEDGKIVDPSKKFGSDWDVVEVFDIGWVTELVPINKYQGSQGWGKTAKNISHQKSPLLKGKRKVSGGSEKKKGGMTQTRYHQTRYTSEQMEKVIVYSGRFQPFHPGHKYIYDHLVEMFGTDDVYIGTSNKTEPFKSPFNFIEKKRIIHELCGVPHRKIIQIKNPYQPSEIFENYDEENTVYITALSEKDSDRLSRKYFKLYNGKEKLKPLTEQGYFIVIPEIKFGGDEIDSASHIREVLGSHSDVSGKIEFFKEIYGLYNEDLFDLMVERLTDHIKPIQITSTEVDDFLIHNDLKKLILEVSNSSQGLVDDGPAFIYRNFQHYKQESDNIIERLGQTIINYIMHAGEKDEFTDFSYRFDIVPVVSFGSSGAQNSESSEPVKEYKNHITKSAEAVGMSIVNWMGAEQSEIDIKVSAPEQYRRKEMMSYYDDGGAMSNDYIDLDGNLHEGLEKVIGDKEMPHIMHPFDNLDLTFRQLKELIVKSLKGDLENVSEKLDGQNLQITWKDSKVGFARNKSQIKNPVSTVNELYRGNVSEVREVFQLAMSDLEKCFGGVLPDKLDEFFHNGKRFLNFEIIYPKTSNVIPYGRSILVFHHIIEYDENGNSVKRLMNEAKELADILISLKYLSRYVGIFDVSAPREIIFRDLSEEQDKWLNRFDKEIRGNLTDDDTLGDYHKAYWNGIVNISYLDSNSDSGRLQEMLTNRWALKDKSFSLREIKTLIDSETYYRIVEHDKRVEKEWKHHNLSLELFFFELGARILQECDGLFADESVVEVLKEDIRVAEKQMDIIDDLGKREKLLEQHEKYTKLNGKLSPTEGIVFIYDGDIYKYTGIFAPVSRFLGLLKY